MYIIYIERDYIHRFDRDNMYITSRLHIDYAQYRLYRLYGGSDVGMGNDVGNSMGNDMGNGMGNDMGNGMGKRARELESLRA